MASALQRHDAVMRAALEARGGYVFKTMGDAFCVAFFTARDAIEAAHEAQQILVSEDFSAVSGLRVRMALHSGTAYERGGDYFGPTVNRVARLLAIGHGGQVLVSGTSAALLESELPRSMSLLDLGAHRLKDLAHPEHVYQLIAPDLPREFPSLRSLDAIPNNLPLQLTSFVGRRNVVSEIKELIASHRLITLAGAGGAGKTRCAIQVGAELLDAYSDGVCLAELAPISDPSLVANVIAQALRLQEQPNRAVLDTLLIHLKRKRLLIILDNCEHVIDEARSVVGAILHACPEVRMLATSRESLHVAGEELYRLPSLAVPHGRFRPDQSSQYEAVQLFLDRALAVDKHFAFTEQNAGHIAHICTRLDGIPLAIELAAARIKVLSPKELAQTLDERFNVLSGGDRSAMPRQQTMRALMDWSYDLLADAEQKLFRKLSIFAGGFSLASAVAVCSTDSIDEPVILDTLTSLIDKSLVQAEVAGDGTRYRLLETTRQYAREKLMENDEHSRVAQAHASAFLLLAQEFERIYDSTPESEWTSKAEPEMENWRAALEWSLNLRRDIMLGQRLVSAMRWMWLLFAPNEGRRWVYTALAVADAAAPESVVAKLQLADAQLEAAFMQPEATYKAAESAWKKLERDDDASAVEAQRYAGKALVFLGRMEEGEMLLRQSLTAAERLGFQKAKAQILGDLATARRFCGDFVEARKLFAQGRAIARVTGDHRAMRALTVRLAELEFHAGNAEAAVQLVREALADAHSKVQGQTAAVMLVNLSAYLTSLRRYDEARAFAKEGLTLAQDAHFVVLTAFALQHLAAIALLRCRDEDGACDLPSAQAARLLGFVDAQLTALAASREYTEQQEYDSIVPLLRDTFGEDELRILLLEGAAWSEEQAASESTVLTGA
jgi:predicted ATPase